MCSILVPVLWIVRFDLMRFKYIHPEKPNCYKLAFIKNIKFTRLQQNDSFIFQASFTLVFQFLRHIIGRRTHLDMQACHNLISDQYNTGNKLGAFFLTINLYSYYPEELFSTSVLWNSHMWKTILKYCILLEFSIFCWVGFKLFKHFHIQNNHFCLNKLS